MNTSEIRQQFLDYFAEKDHRVVPSSPLVPGNDPTLLFTNAGMVQFKDLFLGTEKRDYKRAASSQRCVRAGGKHNDLENVGYTARHHTFFEMLGNFSFGDYFKRDAILFAWELITERFGLPPERLWITVFEDDDEAADVWLKEIGVDPKRFRRLGEKDNFWSMGDTGPCGPCSEIFYDHGPGIPGGPPGSADEHGDRYVEIWNLVFMQFERGADGSMTPLPSPSVDTGMGLERLAAVLQGVHSNYEIDLFANLIRAAAEVTETKDRSSSSLRVIADHIRACAFLIVDGVLPGNEGRGYVLRRIIRRALRHGYELGVSKPFFYRLVRPLDQEMGTAYPELTTAVEHIERVLKTEEERFAETLSHGMGILEAELERVTDNILPGDVVFKLYDTYGFPMDLTADVARSKGVEIDKPGFDVEMQAQKDRARAAQKFKFARDSGLQLDMETVFTGYETLIGTANVGEILKDNAVVEKLGPGETGALVLDRTPFYAESGGQVGDQGIITGADGFVFRVTDTQKAGAAHLHIGACDAGAVRKGDEIRAAVDAERRSATVLNHSATHLLHAALREVLGGHVSQKGSLVAPDRLRFDFSHYEALRPDEIKRIEALVNEQIRLNAPAETVIMSYDEAVNSGAVALFGEKYGDEVRVLTLGEFSVELCGGTHVNSAGDIGMCKITTESGVAAGIRRVEAVTGQAALDRCTETEEVLDRIAGLIKGARADVETRVHQLVARNKALEKENHALKSQLVGSAGADLADSAAEIAGIQVLANRLDDGVDAKVLRESVDRMKDRLGTAVVVLASATADGKVRLAAGVTKDVMDRIKAGELISAVAQRVGGKGGGRADFAQAGGNNPAELNAALAAVPGWVAERLR